MVAAALFAAHLRGAATFPFDFPMTYYASTAYWVASIEAGEWPHWVPYQSMGQPFVTLQTGLFYAPLWVFPALGLPYSLHAATVVQVLHVLAGAAGCALLARAHFRRPLTVALAATSFLLFGGLYTNAEHPDIVRAFALTPWVLWTLTPRRRGIHHRDNRDNRDPSAVSVVSVVSPSALTARPNLLAPAALALFITGAYPGAVIAGLPLFALYVVAQHARDRDRGLLARQAALFALGLALAACHLVPTALASSQLVRSAGAGAMGKAPWFLQGSDLLTFLFSSRAVHVPRPPGGADASMFGLQLPVVLVPFLAFTPWRRLRAVAPLLVLGACAAVMAFEVFRPVSSLLVRLAPPLGLSRFPAADYRLFVALAILFLALAGVEAYAATRRRASRERLLAAAGLSVVVLVLGGLAGIAAPALARPAFWTTLELQAAALGGAVVLLASGRGARLDVAFVGLALLAAVPVVLDLRPHWRDETIERRLYDERGLPLREGERLRVEGIFERALARRPARAMGDRPGDLGFRGWIDGSFMALDYGGAITVGRARVTSDPALLALMLEPGRLIALDPVAGDDVQVDLRAATEVDHEPRLHARNEVAYAVRTDRERLVVENELFAPGWSATLEPQGAALRPVRVNGALRGWRVPAGEHVLRLRCSTPGLAAGAAISALALLAWAALALRQSSGGGSKPGASGS